MRQYLIWTVGDQWILQDTGQRHNRVWHCHWHMHLSRSLCGCWMAARNSAVLRGFLLAALSRRAWLYWAGWTLGLFSISALTRCSCPLSHRTEAFAIDSFVCNMLESQWLLNNLTTAFSLVHQPHTLSASTPLGQCAHKFTLTCIHKHC